LNAFGDFSHGVRAFGHPVFELNVGGERPLFSFHQLENERHRCISLAERQIRAVIDLPVLQMKAEDTVMVLFDYRNRRLAGAGDIMTHVEVDPHIFSVGQYRSFIRLRRHLRMVMEADHNLVLVRNRPEPPGCFFLKLPRDAFGAEGLGYFEVVVDLSVRHIRIADASELDDMDIDSCIIVKLAEGPVLVH